MKRTCEVSKLPYFVCFFACLVTQAGSIEIVPPSTVTTEGSMVTVAAEVVAISDLYAFQFDLRYDPLVIHAVSLAEGGFLSSGGPTFFLPGTIDNIAGLISFTGNTLLGPGPGVTGSGALATFDFLVVGPGSSAVLFENVVLLDRQLAPITVTEISGTISTVPEPGSLWLVFGVITVAGAWQGLYRKRSMLRRTGM